MPVANLLDALSHIYPEDRVLHKPAQLAPYESDALTVFRTRPRAVVLPCSEEEVVETVRLCHRDEIPFVARGSGTSLSGGSLPLEEGIVIALNRLNKILEIDPQKRIARVEPGVFNLDVSAATSSHGLYYAPDPSSQPVCTIGGNIAFNSGGAHCLKHGMTSNHVLGLKAVLPDGELVEMGGESLEGSGSDFTSLFVGSEGLFGVALQVTLRLLPKPQMYRTILAAYKSLGQAGDAVAQVIAAGFLPGALEIMDRLAIQAAEQAVSAGYPAGAEAVLIVELDGDRADVESEFEPLCKVIEGSGPFEIKIARDDEERLRIWKGRKGAFSAVGRLSPDYIVQDGVVPRSRLGEALSEIQRLSKIAQIRVANVFHAGDGNLHPLILFDGTEEGALEKAEELAGQIVEMCIQMGGSITGEHGVGVEKRAYLPKMFSQADITVLKRVRDSVDPKRIANRGKMLTCDEPAEPMSPDPLAETNETASGAEFTPGDIEEVQDLILQHRHVCVKGRGTKTALPFASGKTALLHTHKFRGLIEYEPAEFVFTAYAGTPISEIEEHLQKEGQFLPFDPLLVKRGSTLGGAVASGTGGPGRLKYGGIRDFLIGVRFVTGLGESILGGGKVVKNAAGFDFPKLMVGSLGSLGVLIELTFKVFPRPGEYQTVVLDYETFDDALNGLYKAISSTPATFEAIDLEPPGRLLLRLGGRSGALEKRVAKVLGLLGSGEVLTGIDETSLWGEIKEFKWVPDNWALWKVPLTPDQLPELEARFQEYEYKRRYSVAGNVCWLASHQASEQLEQILNALRLNAVPLFGDQEHRILGPSQVSLFSTRIKQALDPYGRFPEI